MTPTKATAYTFPGVGFVSSADPSLFLDAPNLVAGDFKISKDGSAFINLTDLPTVLPLGGNSIVITLTATEMNADKVAINAIDQDSEWVSFKIGMDIPVSNVDNIFSVLEGDHVETSTSLVVNLKDTTTPLISKTIAGSLLSSSVTVTTKEV